MMEKYRLFDRLLEGVQVIDRDMRYLYLNEVVAKQSKSRIEELTGKRMLDKFPTLKDSEVYSKIEDCMSTGASHSMINEFIHNDGSKGWFDLRIEPIDDGVIIFSFDVTSEKRLEKELEDLNTKIEEKVVERTSEMRKSLEVQRKLNEYKTKFVSIASHQFRTPLASIILSTDIVKKYGKQLEKIESVAKHFTRIRKSANHMVSVLNDFLSLDQLESEHFMYKPEVINFHDLASFVIDSMEPLLKEGQTIKLSIEPTPCYVHLDKEITRGILLNLLSNAIKYSPPGSPVILKAGFSGNTFIFEVIDKGIGIPANEQDKLFSQFYRASNARNEQGSGLGLNIVKQFVEKADGSLSVNSQEGKGSVFSIRFPQKEELLKREL